MAAGFTSKTARRSCAGSWCRVSTGRRKTADTGACSDPRASPTIRPSDACADCRMRTRIPIADRSGAAPPTLPRQQCFTPSPWKTGVAALINSLLDCVAVDFLASAGEYRHGGEETDREDCAPKNVPDRENERMTRPPASTLTRRRRSFADWDAFGSGISPHSGHWPLNRHRAMSNSMLAKGAGSSASAARRRR